MEAQGYDKLVEALRYYDLNKHAADASEALLKENKELIEDHPEMVEADGHWEWRKPNGEVLMPKRGKWIWDDKRCIYVCSMCGSPKVRENMDRQIIKEQAYCYSCGAKMIGEQNVE